MSSCPRYDGSYASKGLSVMNSQVKLSEHDGVSLLAGGAPGPMISIPRVQSSGATLCVLAFRSGKVIPGRVTHLYHLLIRSAEVRRNFLIRVCHGSIAAYTAMVGPEGLALHIHIFQVQQRWCGDLKDNRHRSPPAMFIPGVWLTCPPRGVGVRDLRRNQPQSMDACQDKLVSDVMACSVNPFLAMGCA